VVGLKGVRENHPGHVREKKQNSLKKEASKGRVAGGKRRWEGISSARVMEKGGEGRPIG